MRVLLKLCKIAGFGGIFVGITGYAIRLIYYKKLRGTSMYQEALQAFYSEEKAVQHLGQPITEGTVNFKKRIDNIRNFTVSLKGSKSKGQLICNVEIMEPDKESILRSVLVAFNDTPDQIYIIKES